MSHIEISLRRTNRSADLVRIVRKLTGQAVHEIASAASGDDPLYSGDLNGKDSLEVQEKVLALFQQLTDSGFEFWIALDGEPTNRSTVETIIRTSHQISREQTLFGFSQAEDATRAERFATQSELLLGPRWYLWLAMTALGIAVLILLVLRWAVGLCSDG